MRRELERMRAKLRNKSVSSPGCDFEEDMEGTGSIKLLIESHKQLDVK
jgi:hypothetical protein